ncbi:hypothetical protein F4677DRAFT_440008 [Hypoxylon crocopeplum]|nr:hypothetical protein F4677DRAFT_440008 [Hypoxylon crocopeplum]
MERTPRPYSSSDSRGRSESPPPSYRSNEQSPLLGHRDKPESTSVRIAEAICQCFLTLLMLAVIPGICLLVWYLYKLGSTSRPPFAAPPYNPHPPPLLNYSVAIIGAGPAGISAAQHLRRRTAAGNIHLNIALFESAPVIGGQLALSDSAGGPLFLRDDHTLDPITAEDIAGAALLHCNPLFTKTSEEILGDQVEFFELPSQQVGYFSNDHIVSQTTRPYSKTSFTSMLSLWWKYGSSVWRAGAMIEEGDLRNRLANPPLDPDLTQLMTSLDIIGSVQELAQDALDSRGISDSYVTEILGPQVERAHLQRIAKPDLSALAIILAAFQEDCANSYLGGELIDRLEQIVAATGATVRASTKVSNVKHEQINEKESAWLVEYDGVDSSGPRTETFDKVIIAAPTFDLYQAASAEDVEAASILAYRPAHVTFFTALERLDPKKYGDVGQILFLEQQNGWNPPRGIRELALVREIVRVGEDDSRIIEYLYRAISDSDPTEHLQRLNVEITWLHQARLENAYPYVYPFRKFPPFKLSEQGLWWTSAVHTIASTVDMSWLAGKIVAEELIKDVTK